MNERFFYFNVIIATLVLFSLMEVCISYVGCCIAMSTFNQNKKYSVSMFGLIIPNYSQLLVKVSTE